MKNVRFRGRGYICVSAASLVFISNGILISVCDIRAYVPYISLHCVNIYQSMLEIE